MPAAVASLPRLQTSALTVGGPALHVTLACLTVRSGLACAPAAAVGGLTRKLLSPVCVQLRSHRLVRGTPPASSMLVTLYACWFQIERAPTQRSIASASTCTPAPAPGGC